jgi:hypothetical protein
MIMQVRRFLPYRAMVSGPAVAGTTLALFAMFSIVVLTGYIGDGENPGKTEGSVSQVFKVSTFCLSTGDLTYCLVTGVCHWDARQACILWVVGGGYS